MQTAKILTDAAEIAAAAWNAPAFQTPFKLIACPACDGLGSRRLELSWRLTDYIDMPCKRCNGDCEVAVPNV
jgi:excinuclease UvrABC ATPase subunit